MVRLGSIFRALLTFLFAYLFFIGATFNGVLLPELKLVNLMILVFILLGWLLTHYLRNWTWHSTPFDMVFALWGFAIAVSLVANSESWRRIVIGVWFVVLYVTIWYLVHDMINNRAINRDTFIDAMLMGSLIVVILGYVQISTLSFDLTRLELPRPGSTIGNPNSFGAFLVTIFPLSLARAFMLKNRLAKIILGLYSLALLFLLFLTFSRGAWIGGATALLIMGYLYLQQRGLLKLDELRRWWRDLSQRGKVLLIAMMLGVFVVGIVASYLVIDSLDEGGRNVSLRTNIYTIGVDLIAERPFTGHGLFMFGQGYERLESMPPRQPHSHAHNIILNVGAEMGILGLIAIVVTVAVAIRMMRENWLQSNLRERPALLGTISAVFGFGAHHLFDTPAMMPIIALVGLFVLILATSQTAMPESKPVTIAYSWRRFVYPIGLSCASFMLLASGFWSVNVYQTYWDAIFLADEDNGHDYLGAAEALQSAIDADSSFAIYHSQQGFLYGMFASENADSDALQLGIEAYEQYLEMEPQSAVGWANLAGLYWQDGQQDQAMLAIREAVNLAPNSWQLQLNLGAFAESSGNGDLARQIYLEALIEDTYMLSFWQETELRRDVWSSFVPTPYNLVQQVILDGEPLANDDISILWESNQRNNRLRTDRYILELLLQLLSDDPQNLDDLLENAEAYVLTDSDRAFVHVGRAYLARFVGDMTRYEQEMLRAHELATVDGLEADYESGVNIGNFQFLHIVIPRQFLPQVYYPSVDVFLLRLLEQRS